MEFSDLGLGWFYASYLLPLPFDTELLDAKGATASKYIKNISSFRGFVIIKIYVFC